MARIQEFFVIWESKMLKVGKDGIFVLGLFCGALLMSLVTFGPSVEADIGGEIRAHQTSQSAVVVVPREVVKTDFCDEWCDIEIIEPNVIRVFAPGLGQCQTTRLAVSLAKISKKRVIKHVVPVVTTNKYKQETATTELIVITDDPRSPEKN